MIGDDDITINLPSDVKDISTRVGVFHNKILSRLMIKEAPISKENAFSGASEEFSFIIGSEEYEKEFCDLINICPTLYENLVYDENNESEVILKLLIEALKKGENNKEHTIQTINDYITIIEGNSNMDETERILLYSAMSVASYSCKYWTEDIYDEVIH